MVKRYYASSLLAAYAQPKSRRSLLYSGLVLLLVVGLVLLVFLGDNREPKSNVTGTASRRVIDADLARNLQWLNQQSLPKYRIPAKHKKAALLVAHKNAPAIISQKRLSAGVTVYAQPAAKKSVSVDHVIRAAGGRFLLAGEVLHAVLESAIQSDFAGPVRAILSEPAYSYRGMNQVLPAGTRIIGVYQNSVQAAQVRVGIEWQRMILPNGRSVVFSAPAVDPLGRVGVHATRINTHFWKRFGEASLYSLLSAGAQLAGGSSADTLTAGQLLRSQLSSSFADTAMHDLEENKNIAPTIYLDPGSEISIFVRRDMEF